MSLANTKLIVLDMIGQSIFTIDGEGRNRVVIKEHVDKAPDGIFVDRANGTAYFTQMGTGDWEAQTSYPYDGSIWRMNVDGSDAVMLVGDGRIRTPKQITGDLANGKLYWCDREGMRVMRANLDGSDLEVLVETGKIPEDEQDPRHWAVGIAVDPERRQFYFTIKGHPDSGEGRIFRAGYDLPAGEDPASRSDLEVLFRDLPEPIDLHFDREGGYLYWTDRAHIPGGNSVNRAAIAADGTIASEHEVVVDGLKETIGLVIDHETGHLFTTSVTGELFRARLDGGKPVEIGKFGLLTGIDKM